MIGDYPNSCPLSEERPHLCTVPYPPSASLFMVALGASVFPQIKNLRCTVLLVVHGSLSRNPSHDRLNSVSKARTPKLKGGVCPVQLRDQTKIGVLVGVPFTKRAPKSILSFDKTCLGPAQHAARAPGASVFRGPCGANPSTKLNHWNPLSLKLASAQD